MQLNNLKTKFLGKNNIYYKKIDSTQNEIWRQYTKNAPTGTLVFADIQTDGKGTHGRIWHTDEENNIAFSILIRTNCEINKLEGITIEIAKVIVEIFKNRYNIKLQIKEPNDLIINNKKVGGILTETKLIKEKVQCIIIGIGINTNKQKFTKDIAEIATSIKKELNICINTVEFIEEFCNIFEKIIIERIEK